MTTTTPKPPEGLDPGGRKLYRKMVERYEIADHEMPLVVELARTVDVLNRLHAETRGRNKLVEDGSHGRKINPAVVEARQQRIALARLLAFLRIPVGDQETAPGDEARPQLRSIRGGYDIGGDAS